VIAPQAAKGIGRTAALLERLAATATVVETGHRIVHTSIMPIIDQLPDGDVDHLLLYAPFHDEKGAAVRQLIERLRPRRATIAVQSDGRTVIQPDALRLVLASLNAQFDVLEDAGKRYRHGAPAMSARPRPGTAGRRAGWPGVCDWIRAQADGQWQRRAAHRGARAIILL
jgi:hypothetical protein